MGLVQIGSGYVSQQFHSGPKPQLETRRHSGKNGNDNMTMPKATTIKIAILSPR